MRFPPPRVKNKKVDKKIQYYPSKIKKDNQKNKKKK